MDHLLKAGEVWGTVANLRPMTRSFMYMNPPEKARNEGATGRANYTHGFHPLPTLIVHLTSNEQWV